jgi:dihydropteroate synthase
MKAAARDWHIRGHTLTVGGRALVMGIVNVTPDSFSDGGRYFGTEAAVAHGLELVARGADLLDIGGESTRPGAAPVPADEELARVVPVVEALAGRTEVPLSVDTSKAVVARECLRRGAHIINDVTALAGDPEMTGVVRDAGAGAILMHMQGTPATMQLAPQYADVVEDVTAFLEARLHAAESAGLEAGRVVLDPGIGFGKTRAHNLALLAGLAALQRLGRPVCLGVSRKGFLAKVVGRQPGELLAASLAVACHAVLRGAAQIVRVHDVRETRDAVTMLAALAEARSQG